MNKEQIQRELEQRAEEAYRNFSAGLLPGVRRILGVRLPALRALAKQLAHTDGKKSLSQIPEDSLEGIMLQGMVIGYLRCPVEERLALIQDFVPKIDNWSVCDSFCVGLKFAKAEKDKVWTFLQPYLHSDREFAQRFGCVMLLNYYIDDAWLSRTVEALLHVNAKEYYAKMALAWAMAECYLQDPAAVLPILQQNLLAPDVQQKALQKIIESRTITPKVREEIRALKQEQRERAAKTGDQNSL